MSDGVLSETIQNVQQAIQQKDPKPIAHPASDDTSGNHLSYFRHKGTKVKFEDIENALDWYNL